MAALIATALAEAAQAVWHEGMPRSLCADGRCDLCAGRPAIIADDSVAAALDRTAAIAKAEG